MIRMRVLSRTLALIPLTALLALAGALTLPSAGARAAGTPASGGPGPAAGPAGACPTGQLCLWERPGFGGARHTYEISVTGTGQCVKLPPDTSAEALANRMGRPVTAYQSHECEETGEFHTYPGDGVWLPRATYRIRAFKVWEQ